MDSTTNLIHTTDTSKTIDITNITDEQIIAIIKNIVYNSIGCAASNILNSEKQHMLRDFIYEKTSYLNEYDWINFQTRCHVLINRIEELPRCEVCNSVIRQNAHIRKGFKLKTCSKSCAALNERRKLKIKNTLKERYGDENFNNREKCKKTCLEKYGVEFSFQSEQQKIKANQTKLEKYGDPKFTNIKKTFQTKLEKYGDMYYNNSRKQSQTKKYKASYDDQYWKKINMKAKLTNIKNGHVQNWNNKDKAIQTMKQHAEADPNYWISIHNKISLTKLQRYGDENFNNREKCKKTCLEKYGVDNCLKSESIKDKIRKTNIQKYGVPSAQQNKEINNRTVHTKNVRWYNDIIAKSINDIIPMFTFEEFDCRDDDTVFKWKCKKCNTTFQSPINFQNANRNGEYAICPNCKNIKFENTEQYEVLQFVKQFTLENDVFFNDRIQIFPKEIDIFIKSKNIGIEYNGMYWHSQYIGTSPKQLIFKKNLCECKNIKLFHIFEDEWKERNVAIKTFLKNIIIGKKDYATDQLEIRELSMKEAKSFSNLYSTNLFNEISEYNYGLFISGNLVSMMTLTYHMHKIIINDFMQKEFIQDGMKTLIKYIFKDFSKRCRVDTILIKINECYNCFNDIQDFSTIISRYNAMQWIMNVNDFKRIKVNVNKKNAKTTLNLNDYDYSMSLYQNLANNNYTTIFDCGITTYKINMQKL